MKVVLIIGSSANKNMGGLTCSENKYQHNMIEVEYWAIDIRWEAPTREHDIKIFWIVENNTKDKIPKKITYRKGGTKRNDKSR